MSRSNAHTPCATCHGMGFLAEGAIADRVFVRCVACGGCGQVYLDPAVPPPVDDEPLAPWTAYRYLPGDFDIDEVTF